MESLVAEMDLINGVTERKRERSLASMNLVLLPGEARQEQEKASLG